MPEGHTLHRLARAQRARFAGAVVRVSSPQGRFPDAALVDGRVLDTVTAHGKHLFAAFGDRIVHVHLGLFGKVASGDGDPPPPVGAVRMRWVAATGWSDLRGPTAGEVLFRHRVDPYLPGRLLDESRWLPLWTDLVALMRAGLRSGRIVTTERSD